MLRALGVTADQKRILLYIEEIEGGNRRLSFTISTDGTNFSKAKALPKTSLVGLKVGSGQIWHLRFSTENKKSFATFLLASGSGGNFLYQTSYKAPAGFTKTKKNLGIDEPAVLSEYGANLPLLFFGNKNINMAAASAAGKWKISSTPLLRPRANYFDGGNLQVGHARLTEQGILLSYYCRLEGEENALAVGAALVDKHNPEKLLWRSDFPIWRQADKYAGKKLQAVGEADFGGKSFLFLQDEFGNIFSVILPVWNSLVQAKTHTRKPRLNRSHKNPVLSPKQEHDWESKASFNPAAFVAEGRVHLIYRAIGNDDISSFGYASSHDGIHFDERLDYPVYIPRRDFEGRNLKKTFELSQFASGGTGIGGCEDPRVSLIGDMLYMTYVAFDGWRPPRVALTSISLQDFLSHRWNWREPALISPYLPNEGNKNSCILPEKINGQYVIFHRIWPDILIDYADNLNFNGKDKFLSKQGHAKISPRKTHWDSQKVGIGATPIKTSAGWLLIYQAVGKQDGSKYKIGAMLLDLQNPSKVIARSNAPILEPEAWYENEGWKYGVVYPCGAAVMGEDLLVYYGGADTYTCVAKANLEEFVSHLLTHRPAGLTQVAL